MRRTLKFADHKYAITKEGEITSWATSRYGKIMTPTTYKVKDGIRIPCVPHVRLIVNGKRVLFTVTQLLYIAFKNKTAKEAKRAFLCRKHPGSYTSDNLIAFKTASDRAVYMWENLDMVAGSIKPRRKYTRKQRALWRRVYRTKPSPSIKKVAEQYGIPYSSMRDILVKPKI